MFAMNAAPRERADYVDIEKKKGVVYIPATWLDGEKTTLVAWLYSFTMTWAENNSMPPSPSSTPYFFSFPSANHHVDFVLFTLTCMRLEPFATNLRY